jgi:NAD(P)-dependent dehydrogenase (short-subunit alcohol dehydrogenase family)
MGKLGMPEDIANMAYFLGMDESKYMTGTIIPVDGGNSIGF